MDRSFRSFMAVFCVALGLITFCNIADAGVPDPLLSTVPNVVTSPDGSMGYTVNVAGSGGPIDSSLVQIVFSAECQSYLCWCVGQVYAPSIDDYTDALGDVTFNIAAGGCVDPTLLVSDPYCARVFADGVQLADVGIVSSDRVDPGGLDATSGWNPGGTCLVASNDGVAFTPPFVSNIYEFCSDINSDLLVNATDAVIVTPGIVSNSSCTQAP